MAVCKRVHIMYVISTLANEGPTRVLLNIIRNLDRSHFSPLVVTINSEKQNSMLPEFNRLDIPIIQLGNSTENKARGITGRLRELKQLVIESNMDIIHAHCPRSLMFLVAINSSSAKSFYTLHIYPEHQYNIIHGPIKGRLITALSNFALRFIDRPIACSDSVAFEYLTHKGLSFSAVNNGIEPLVISDSLSRSSALQYLGLDPNRRYLLYIGRLSSEKRIVELARTFSSMDRSEFSLVVVGAGPEEAALQSIECSHIHLMGFHADIRQFLVGCDFYISPSATEGLANTLLEAMSVGMPSLLSDISSHRFVIEQCSGFVGTLFDPLSKESMLEGMACVLEHDSDVARTGIKENFRSLFHAQVMTRGYESIYREMIA